MRVVKIVDVPANSSKDWMEVVRAAMQEAPDSVVELCSIYTSETPDGPNNQDAQRCLGTRISIVMEAH